MTKPLAFLAAGMSFIMSFFQSGSVLSVQDARSDSILILPTATPTTAIVPTSTSTLAPSQKPTPKPTSTPTPTPSVTPTPVAVSGQQLDGWFSVYGDRHGVDKALLRRIAVCESRLNPSAINGSYAGLYQFAPSTWISTRRSMNETMDPILRFDPEQAIHTAAYKIRRDGAGAWPNCSS